MEKEPTSGAPLRENRVYVKGKFLYCGPEKLYIKGVTYGTFAPREDGFQFPAEDVVERDFALMAENGFNCVRTYTVPPHYLLDIASAHGLKVMVGLPWEQHVTFLDHPEQKADIVRRVKEGVLACGRHPAVLCFAVGNEIPPGIVRWYGKGRIEAWLRELYRAVKTVDPDSLVTYVNFPTTEYLELGFLDFDCFNVYLETPEKLSAYIQRLHNLTGDRPLVLAEIGLDSRRNGEEQQAEVLRWQLETIFGKGCAGMFVFAWTDEWWRGGFEIDDWDFGLVDRQRQPKPALEAVRLAMQHVPVPQTMDLPSISVVVCSYNGSATIRETLENLTRLDYPTYEVIVINDGSRDHTAAIAREFPVRLVSTPNRGLSSARNTGMRLATGEIVAYLDDDAYPDPHWLHYLAYAYRSSTHDCIGGPNLAPYDDGPIAACVANAPGGPTHVLETDEIAEHVPGCNMTFRREALLKIGGFDPVYRVAGDDVDACWRIQQAGGTIGFHPSAVVWHHRRNSIRAYWRQQKGYGKAEALLEAKWPEKYNALGHLTWNGRIYGNGYTLPIKVKKDRIFHGTWGTALFQSVYQPASGLWNWLPLMPEWYLVAGWLAVFSSLGFFWEPLLLLWPVFVASVAVVVVQAVLSAYKNALLPPHRKHNVKYRLMIVLLHLIQPVARLHGRLSHGLTPWRTRGTFADHRFLSPFLTRRFAHWSEKWRAPEDWLTDLEEKLMAMKTQVRRGDDFDHWDLQVINGVFVHTKCLLAIEEHGAGRQYLRLKCWKGFSGVALTLFTVLLAVSIGAAWQQEFIVSAVTGLLALALITKVLFDGARSMNSVFLAFTGLPDFVEREEKRTAPKVEEELHHQHMVVGAGIN